MQDVGRIQPEALFNNLVTTQPSASNIMAIMVHGMASGDTKGSFATMSKGVQA